MVSDIGLVARYDVGCWMDVDVDVGGCVGGCRGIELSIEYVNWEQVCDNDLDVTIRYRQERWTSLPDVLRSSICFPMSN